MSYAFVEDVAASRERYERFAAALAGSAPEDLILHAAGPSDEGYRIVVVWTSEEASLRFAERVAPPARSAPPPVFRALRPAHVVYGEREENS
jgi:hypothetical protein